MKNQNIKEQLILKLPFICLFYILILVIVTNFYICMDDSYYFKIPINLRYGNYIIERYQTWSSRLLIDSLAVLLVKTPALCVLTVLSLVYTLIAYNISNLFSSDKKVIKNIIICLLMLFFPFKIETSTGIVATSVNYVVPVLFALICLNYFYKIDKINNLKGKKYIILYILAFLIATDSEQMSLVAFFGFIIYFIYGLYKKRKINKYIITFFVILILKIIFIFICPGNHLRYYAEIETWYKEYETFNLIDKINMGIMYSTRVLVSKQIIIILFGILISFLTFLKSNKQLHRIYAIILGVMIILCTINLNIFNEFKMAIFNNGPQYSLFICIPILMFIMTIFLIMINFKHNKLIMITIPMLGVLSQMLMCFSPTIYASEYRTGTIMYFSFIILNYFCVIEILDILKDKRKKVKDKKI